MSLQVEPLDPATFSYKDACAAAAMMAASFAGEPYARVLWGPRSDFIHDQPIAPEHVGDYHSWVRVNALMLKSGILKGEFRGFVTRKAGEIVGMVLWAPARGAVAGGPKPTLAHRVRKWTTAAQLALWNWWDYGRGPSPVVPTAGASAMGRKAALGAGRQFESAAAEAARRAELAHLPPDELARTPYPQSEVHHCVIMLIAPSHQRQGLGRKLFVESAKQLPVYSPEFCDGKGTSVRAPPQFQLYATNPGKPMYRSLGFESAHQHTETVRGVEVTRDLFIKSTPF